MTAVAMVKVIKQSCFSIEGRGLVKHILGNLNYFRGREERE